MALPVKQQVQYWGIALAAIFILLWALGDVLMPFLLGGAIAYCLDPIADRLERLGFSRALAVTTITLIAGLIFVLAFLLIAPTLTQQATQLVETAPELFEKLKTWLTERIPQLQNQESVVRQQLDRIGELLETSGGTLISSVLSSALSLINVVVLLVVVPVVTFYLLLDWDNMTARIDEMLPRDHAPQVRELARQIDSTLASFIRGQGMVCLILGTFYAVCLMLVGLNFGLVIGAIAGLVTFIPYVGALIGGALSLGLALFQFWGDWLSIGLVALIFVIGQFVEGNILTPRLVGSSIGLHPVWLLFALSAFGSLFGFVGLLVAVPVAAVIGVLVRFGITRYKSGRLYKGLSDLE